MEDMVQATVIREVGGKKGSIQEFVDGGKAARDVADRREMFGTSEERARAAVFDHVIGNEDRHPGNWMIRPDGRVALIDHGLAFPDKGKENGFRNTMFEDVVKSDPPAKSPAEYAKKYVENKDAILGALKARGLSDKSVEGVGKRIDALANATNWDGLGKQRMPPLPPLFGRGGRPRGFKIRRRRPIGGGIF
jgi:hypothetical protein